MLPISKQFFKRKIQRLSIHHTSGSKDAKIFDKILIANRGEIAIRVMKTAKEMGIKCVAVYSEADRNSQHVKFVKADEAFLIGPAPSSESYLCMEKIIEAMRSTGAQAVHPGYGFLSENYKFAEKLENSELTFIGPPSAAIKAMGSKSESKTIMEHAGVPCVPGYHGENQDPEHLAEKANHIGYPIMIKAVLGGGGKGMRVAKSPDEFMEMLQSAKRESAKSFGDDRVLLEKYVEKSRHIEVQVFGDKYGNCVYFFERDCSVQRRNQKVIEEAPAPNLNSDLRRQLGEKAVAAAKAVSYVGPGTVEFIFDCSDQTFYFMEMNTRLQVEHPVTEMITGHDLVEWQIKVAAGYPLTLKQEDLKIDGHSMEARIYAENPAKNFMPDTGKLKVFSYPTNDPNLRVETGVQQGDEISIYYDPMIAKVIVKGNDRKEAIRKLDSALANLHVADVSTNIPFIRKILQLDDFRECNFDTGLIPKHQQQLKPESSSHSDEVLVAASIATILSKSQLKTLSNETIQEHDGLAYFRNGANPKELARFKSGGERIEVSLQMSNNFNIQAKLSNSSEYRVSLLQLSKDHFSIQLGSKQHRVKYHITPKSVYIWSSSLDNSIIELVQDEAILKSDSKRDHEKESGRILAPMPCKITQMLVKTGDQVKPGTPLCITEAMKMEQIIKSELEGFVTATYYQVGDIAADQSTIMVISADKEAKQNVSGKVK